MYIMLYSYNITTKLLFDDMTMLDLQTEHTQHVRNTTYEKGSSGLDCRTAGCVQRPR